MKHSSVNDIEMCFSLRISVTLRERLAWMWQFMNIICNDRYLEIFWMPKRFGHFSTTLPVSIDLWIGQDLRNVRILHFYRAPVYGKHPLTRHRLMQGPVAQSTKTYAENHQWERKGVWNCTDARLVGTRGVSNYQSLSNPKSNAIQKCPESVQNVSVFKNCPNICHYKLHL